jgi:CubicO group peptidase (beta-lactamase class C family)
MSLTKMCFIQFYLTTFFVLSGQCFASNSVNFDKLLKNHVDDKGPGVSVIVTKAGQTIYEGARGKANIELSRELSVSSEFKLASITKQFTSAALLMLQEQGKLSITDKVHKYLPNLAPQLSDITIEHLMSHTSGLYRNPKNIRKHREAAISLDDLMTLLMKENIKFPPGKQMSYSNSGYLLLGKIIEVVSKQTYGQFIEANIFNKLGMNNSYYGSKINNSKEVIGYYQTRRAGIKKAKPIDVSWSYAAGGLVSSVDDLAIWYRSLSQGLLISEQSYKMMITGFKLNDGSFSRYGFGLNNIKIHNHNAIIHQGSTPGFKNSAVYFPEEDIYIAVLSNDYSSKPFNLTLLLSAEILGINYPDYAPFAIEQSQLNKFLGRYKIDKDSTRTLFIEEGIIYTRRDDSLPYEVMPISKNSFVYKGSLDYFVIDEDDTGKLTLSYYPRLSAMPQEAIKLNN